jgi:hypothetical protein
MWNKVVDRLTGHRKYEPNYFGGARSEEVGDLTMLRWRFICNNAEILCTNV